MADKLQIPHPIRTLSNAVRIHLADFASNYEEDFSYGWDREGAEVEYFKFRFARVVATTRWNWKQQNLGSLRLRRLNRSLTEMVIEDSPGLTVGPDLFLNTEYVRFGDYDNDGEISTKERKKRGAVIFEHFKAIHHQIRETVIEGLKQDHLLLGEEKIAVLQPNKSDVTYVDKSTIARLRQVRSPNFDLQRLIRLCEELNKCSAVGAFCATAALVRAVIDHVPPIFGARAFGEVANNVGEKSIKASLLRLETSSRNIADSVLHQQVRKREVIPTRTQVNFSNDLEVLLGEVVRRLS